jgi:hypothetical protein
MIVSKFSSTPLCILPRSKIQDKPRQALPHSLLSTLQHQRQSKHPQSPNHRRSQPRRLRRHRQSLRRRRRSSTTPSTPSRTTTRACSTGTSLRSSSLISQPRRGSQRTPRNLRFHNRHVTLHVCGETAIPSRGATGAECAGERTAGLRVD